MHTNNPIFELGILSEWYHQVAQCSRESASGYSIGVQDSVEEVI